MNVRIQPLYKFIVDRFLFGDGEGLSYDTNFFESGIVDSIGILEIIAFVERHYGVMVADDDMVPQNFSSLNTVHNYLVAKDGGQTRAQP